MKFLNELTPGILAYAKALVAVFLALQHAPAQAANLFKI